MVLPAGFITDHFTWQEVQLSDICSRRGLDNTPPENIRPAIVNTAKQMERVRALLGKPIHVTSWYRCEQLQTILHSPSTSQHPKGEAVDFICPETGTPLQICKLIVAFPELVKFDQLIMEHSWVHISFSSDPSRANRMEVLSLNNNGVFTKGLP